MGKTSEEVMITPIKDMITEIIKGRLQRLNAESSSA
jgi:hypothetical protein